MAQGASGCRCLDFQGRLQGPELFRVLPVRRRISAYLCEQQPRKNAPIFTLFHELAHLLFHTSGIDLLTDDFIQRLPADERRIEIICNRFAAEFLVPERAFNAAFEGRPPTEATAEHLAE